MEQDRVPEEMEAAEQGSDRQMGAGDMTRGKDRQNVGGEETTGGGDLVRA